MAVQVRQLEQTGLFKSVEAVSSVKEGRNDLFISADVASIWHPQFSVISGYSRRKLYSGSQATSGYAQYGFDLKLIGPMVARAFAKGTPLHAEVAAGRDAYLAKKEPARPPSAGVSQPTEFHSDVDTPRFQMAEIPDNFALVIGIEKYSGDLPAAQFAERDAAAVKNNLIALGYPERNIKFLTGDRATKGRLEAILEDWLPRMAKPDGSVFFYFSGHGAPNTRSDQAYLVPWDGDPSLLDKTAYPLKKLYASLNALKAKRIIVVLDSCFSGAGGRSVLAEGARPLVTKVDTSVESGSKLVLFAAASPQEITATLKEQGHGIFTYYFLKGLGGEAKDGSGAITPRGLYDYLKPKVQDAASRQNRDQTPVLDGATEGEITRFK